MRTDLRETDALVAWQWESTHRNGSCPPERRLLVAVLGDALSRLRKAMESPRPDDPELIELQRWFSACDSGPFSFEYICEQLGLDADGIRRKLKVLVVTPPPPRPPRRRVKSAD